MVDRSLASDFGDGGIIALNNSNRLNGFVIGLYITTLGTVIYPALSKLSSINNKEKLAEAVLISVNCVNLLVLPAVIRILFQRVASDF